MFKERGETADSVLQVFGGASDLYLALSPNPTIEVSPTSLSFSMTPGGTLPPGQQFFVASRGPEGSVLEYTLTSNQPWLGVPTNGFVQAGFVAQETTFLQDSARSLPAGDYDAVITVADSNAPGQTAAVPAHLKITAPLPAMTVTPTALSFSATRNGLSPAIQAVTVTNSGESGSRLTCSVSDNAPWLIVSGSIQNLPSGGSATLQVFCDMIGLAVGAYSATITVSAAGSLSPPQTVTVTLTIVAQSVNNLTGAWVGPYSLTYVSPYNGSTVPQSGQLTLNYTEHPNHTLTGSVFMTNIVIFNSDGTWFTVTGSGSVTGTATRSGSNVQVFGNINIPTAFGTFDINYELFSWADGSLDGYFFRSDGSHNGAIHVVR